MEVEVEVEAEVEVEVEGTRNLFRQNIVLANMSPIWPENNASYAKLPQEVDLTVNCLPPKYVAVASVGYRFEASPGGYCNVVPGAEGKQITEVAFPAPVGRLLLTYLGGAPFPGGKAHPRAVAFRSPPARLLLLYLGATQQAKQCTT